MEILLEEIIEKNEEKPILILGKCELISNQKFRGFTVKRRIFNSLKCKLEI